MKRSASFSGHTQKNLAFLVRNLKLIYQIMNQKLSCLVFKDLNSSATVRNFHQEVTKQQLKTKELSQIIRFVRKKQQTLTISNQSKLLCFFEKNAIIFLNVVSFVIFICYVFIFLYAQIKNK